MKKTLTVLLALVLVIAMSVAGTMAYLTSTTGPVTNTFTVGKVEITLDESKVDMYGVVDPDADGRVTENSYRLIPGKNYKKDPVVHFQPDSEASWLFVKVENGIETYEADTKTIASQITANGWTKLTGVTGVDNVYYQQVPANFTDAAVDYKVFQEFTIADNADASGTPTVTVTAYAIQAEGFTTPADAWAKVSTT